MVECARSSSSVLETRGLIISYFERTYVRIGIPVICSSASFHLLLLFHRFPSSSSGATVTTGTCRCFLLMKFSLLKATCELQLFQVLFVSLDCSAAPLFHGENHQKMSRVVRLTSVPRSPYKSFLLLSIFIFSCSQSCNVYFTFYLC